jgi:hypothetical protein
MVMSACSTALIFDALFVQPRLSRFSHFLSRFVRRHLSFPDQLRYFAVRK